MLLELLSKPHLGYMCLHANRSDFGHYGSTVALDWNIG